MNWVVIFSMCKLNVFLEYFFSGESVVIRIIRILIWLKSFQCIVLYWKCTPSLRCDMKVLSLVIDTKLCFDNFSSLYCSALGLKRFINFRAMLTFSLLNTSRDANTDESSEQNQEITKAYIRLKCTLYQLCRRIHNSSQS